MKPIGGYFSLELSQNNSFNLNDGIFLNSGRNALEYILRALEVKKIRIPFFTCNVVLEPIEKLNVLYIFYHIDEKLEIPQHIDLEDNEFILYTNYYGIKDQYVSTLVEEYGDKLIIDNAQALYATYLQKTNAFYSPRKFIGIPDGGIAVTTKDYAMKLEQDQSYDRCSHLLKRIDLGSIEAYADFRENSHKLVNQEIKLMSNLTKRLITSIDFEKVRENRLENFSYLHSKLHSTNKIIISDIDSFVCPLVYPYYTEDTELKKKLIENKIFVATYWPNIFEWCEETDLEYQLANNVIAIPIDQRYGIDEMSFIINTIHTECERI